jgi:hypothetical protein
LVQGVAVAVPTALRQLLSSLLSPTAFRSSAQEIRKQLPTGIWDGTLTETVPVDSAPL